MLQPEGTIFELVFVVHDIERSIANWAHDLRAGPFFTGSHLLSYLYNGVERTVDLKFAAGFSGSMLIELVQPDDQPSVFRDHLVHRGEGLHHMQLRCTDFQSEVGRLHEAGYKHVATGEIPGSGSAEYFDTYANYGCMLKVLPISKEGLAGLAKAQEAHASWDSNTKPMRSLAELGAQLLPE